MSSALSHLGNFIRSPVGLDRETTSQLEFVDLIVQYLTENGVMNAARLYESPFTDISQQGPEALFLPGKVTEMVRVLDDIWQRAAA
jgi:type I restriction enzyme R subunit